MGGRSTREVHHHHTERVEVPVVQVKEVERVVKEFVHASPPCANWVNFGFKVLTPNGCARFRMSEAIHVEVTVRNTSHKPFTAGTLSYKGTSMFHECHASVPAIPVEGSVTVNMVLERKSSHISDMVPTHTLTYTNPEFSSYTQTEPNPVYLYLEDIRTQKPTSMITHEGVQKLKPCFVFIIIGEAGSGKSSMWNALLTLAHMSLDKPLDWEADFCGVGGTGEHSTEDITRFMLNQAAGFLIAGLDGWGVDSDTWQDNSHILDYARGYLRQGMKMRSQVLANPLTPAIRARLEPTRQINEANVVAVTISADSLNGDNPVPKANAKRIADAVRKEGFPVIVVVTKVDKVSTPDSDCRCVRDDTESPAAKAACRTLIETAKKEFGIPETSIYLCIGHNVEGMDTPQQRWNIDRMHLRILNGMINAAQSSDWKKASNDEAQQKGMAGPSWDDIMNDVECGG